MKIYAFSAELESAVIELLEDTTFLLPQLSNSDTPAYVKALRQLKATRPSVFQISTTAAKSDHPGDKNDVGNTLSKREGFRMLRRTGGRQRKSS